MKLEEINDILPLLDLARLLHNDICHLLKSVFKALLCLMKFFLNSRCGIFVRTPCWSLLKMSL